MRLSDHILIKKTVAAPPPARPPAAPGAQFLPARNATHSVVGARAGNAIPTSLRVGIAGGPLTATQKAPGAVKITQPAPGAKNGCFSMSALIKKKNITPARDAPPVEPMEQEPAVAAMPAKATDEPVIFTPQKTVPVTVKPPPVSPNRHEPTAEIGPVAPVPVPPPNISTKKAEAVAEAPPRIMESTPPLAQADAPAAANASCYEERPGEIYDICRQFGIAVPEDRSALIEQARACLVTIFKKIILPAPEQYMIWPMIKSIASDLDGIIATDTTILNFLHRYRAKKEKLVWHSIYTAILAMDLAKNEENLSCSVCEIGGAALLHDAGFLIQTTNGFDTNEFDNIADKKSPEFRKHVDKSTELAHRIEAPDAVVTMIAQHQGRLDGRGYPKNLTPSRFERCSQILAIANIFEHTIIDLSMEIDEAAPGTAGENSENGITYVFREYRKAFDVDLLKKMIALVGFYPVNSIIELNNRAICKVVKQNNDFPLRPVVQVVMDGTGMHPEQEKLIDLKEIKVLSILRTLANSERKTKP